MQVLKEMTHVELEVEAIITAEALDQVKALKDTLQTLEESTWLSDPNNQRRPDQALTAYDAIRTAPLVILQPTGENAFKTTVALSQLITHLTGRLLEIRRIQRLNLLADERNSL